MQLSDSVPVNGYHSALERNASTNRGFDECFKGTNLTVKS